MDLSKTEQRLIDLLPLDGTPRTNADLQTQLAVSEEEYWFARDRLREKGLVIRRRGRGGSTGRG